MQFGRVIKLAIGQPGKIGREFEDLRIVFDIAKSLTMTSMQGSKIDIYNLSESSIAELQKKKISLFLFAGYEEGEGLQMLYFGDVTSVINKYQPPDTVTELLCGTAAFALASSISKESFAPGTNSNQIIDKLVKNLGFTLKNTDYKENNYTIKNGMAITGKTKDALKTVLDKADLQMSMVDDKAQIVKKGKPNFDVVYEYTPQTGLIGIPEKIQTTGLDQTLDTQPTAQYQIKVLLNPRLNPGGRIKINSREIHDAVYRIESIQHQGDTRGDEWLSTLQVSEMTQ
jgi:hypothetical protein